MVRPRTIAIGLVLLTQVGCTSEYRDVGRYRVLAADDNFFGLICQTRQEFYFLQSPSENGDPTYLGTCGTPRFITDHLHMVGDPSCFAVSEAGESIVYLHRPKLCGAGAKAAEKPGGVYVHVATRGDRLRYPDSQINQIWGGENAEPGAVRVRWAANSPSRAGAMCGQTLVMHADGREEVEGLPEQSGSRCQ